MTKKKKCLLSVSQYSPLKKQLRKTTDDVG